MSMNRSNRLAMIIAIALASLTVIVLLITWLSGHGGSFGMRSLPKAPTPDADSPATVIKTMAQKVETLRDENNTLAGENKSMRSQFSELQKQFERLADRQSPGLAQNNGALKTLKTTVQQLQSRLQTMELNNKGPVSVDFSAPNAGYDDSTTYAELVWVEPLDADAKSTDDTSFSDGHLLPVALNPSLGGSLLADRSAVVNGTGQFDAAPALLNPPIPSYTTEGGGAARNTQPEPIPYYTIPPDSTLLNATAWTALLGRVPVGGQVRDPWRFKVLTGADNLAANGIRIPNISGMIWSGIAVGDLTLRCVRGTLYSVTYVFKDGSINNVRGDSDKPLGWISDHSGVPCIPGELKTNAAKFLLSRTGLFAFEAGARAIAQSETTRYTTPLGGTTSIVDGDVGRYALGTALGDGAAEAGKWLRERQRNSFDAVFVAPGVALTINVEELIPIDKDPNGRKISYHRQRSDYRTSNLD